MTDDAPTATAAAPRPGPAATPALELRGLSSGYDGVAVVHEVDLTVAPGEVVALLGSNGAGKSTTLLTVSGLLPRLAGDLLVLGEPVPMRRSSRVRDVCSIVHRGVAHVPRTAGCSST